MDNKEIVTHYIFIDTSIFIKENFLAGSKLKSFLKYAENSKIELLTTSITKQECQNNLEQDARNSYSFLRKKVKEIDNKVKVLKNIPRIKEFFELDTKIDFDNEVEEMEDRLHDIFIDQFSEIEIDSTRTLKIVDDYFKKNPPFNDGKKKYEFPDAIVLNSLEAWCKKKNRKIYVVADDGDFLSYKSEYLIPIKEYDKLLAQISYTFGKENITQKIIDQIFLKDNDFLEETEKEFRDKFPWGGFDETQGFEYDTNDVVTFNGYINEVLVLEINDQSAKVEIAINVDYEVDITYEDPNTGWYDKEDNRWYGLESRNTVVSGNCELKVIANIEIDLIGKEIEFIDWYISEISGIPENIDIYE